MLGLQVGEVDAAQQAAQGGALQGHDSDAWQQTWVDSLLLQQTVSTVLEALGSEWIDHADVQGRLLLNSCCTS